MPREMVDGPEPSAAEQASAPAASHRETVDFATYLTRKQTTRHRELLDFRLYLHQRDLS
jgi:hypothetical protein